MKQQKVTELFTVRHKTKRVHCSMSQHSSTHHIFTKVKQLLIWR